MMAMFDDKRSKKLVLLAHCILNQNAKLDRCAHYPGTIRGVAEALLAADVGLVQMPCPELLCLGLERQTDLKRSSTVEAEDTRIAGRMGEDEARTTCEQIANDLVYQIEEYRKHGFGIKGVIGINGSPTCGVETSWSEGREYQGPGVFMQIFSEKLERKSLAIPMKGIKAYEPEQAACIVTELLEARRPGKE